MQKFANSWHLPSFKHISTTVQTFGTEGSVSTQKRLQTAQNKTIRYVLKLPARQHIDFAHYIAIKWLNVKHRVDYLTLTHVYKCQNGLSPDYLQNFTKVSDKHGHFTRHCIESLVLPFVKTHGKKGFMYNGAFLWNELPPTVQDSSNLVTLKKHGKNHLLNSMYHYF